MPRSGYQKRIDSLSPTYWLRFDEDGTPSDYGSSSLSVSVTGTPTYNQTSTFGTQTDKSVLLGGSAGFTSTASASVFNDKVFSVECWFKIASGDVAASGSNYHTFFSASNGSQEVGFRMKGAAESVGERGKIQGYIVGGSGFNVPIALSSSTYHDNAWHHAVLSINTTNVKLYIDGSEVSSVSTGSMPTSLGLDTSSVTKYIGFKTNEGTKGSLNEFAIYNSALTSTEVSDNYAARNFGNYDAEVGIVSTSTLPMPTISAGTGNTIATDPMTTAFPHAEFVIPGYITSTNLDGFGVATASALAVDPSVSTTQVIDINYSADPSTASATSPDATVAAQKFVSVSADPATASALLSSNVFAGESNQDTSYNLSIRRVFSVNSNNLDGKSGFNIGTQSTGLPDTIDSREAVVIKANSGFPAYNKIIKVKFDSSHVTATTLGGDGTANTFNIYVLTANPTSGTFDTAAYSSFTPVREYLYTTRSEDDSSSGQLYLDLTPAFADTRTESYGIMIEHVHTETSGSGTVYDRTEFTGNNLDVHLLYVLSSDIINKNVNADAMTASALATDATIATEIYVSIAVDPSTASATTVTPTAGLSIGFNAAPATASGEAVQPTFSRTVEYPAEPATAFAEPVMPTVVIQGSNNYVAAPATAEALFHMPQANIGENHIADHMNASALFVMPTLIIPESVDAMTTTASATMVQPTAALELLGAVSASPMTASTDIINPPAYVNLFADKWYDLLYTQHSRPHGFRTGFGGNGEAILKLFADVAVDKAIGSTIPNNLTQTITTDGLVVGSTAPALNVSGEFVSSNPPLISTGYFDNLSRKAVRFNNITAGEEQSEFGEYEFTFELAIKTTKADQIIAFGRGAAQSGNQRRAGVLGLSDGKLFVNTTQTIGRSPILHYKELGAAQEFAVIGNKNIADGQWHHIVVQHGFGDARLQIWVDGELDRQTFDISRIDGFTFLGHSTNVATYASDFYASAWSYDSHRFISEQEVDDHNFAYINFEPVKAEPMVASLTSPNNATGKGNRKRALMLYFWPTSPGQNQNLITSRFVDNTFDNQLETRDYVAQPPQQYFGWDVFPVDITGYFVSDLVKEEAYGGSRNIVNQTDSFPVTQLLGSPTAKPIFKTNRKGYFRDTLTDTARYINLTEDIDLSQFDAIFFKNYPDESIELDSYARNEVVDAYFNLRENVIFENFLKSLRAAVDTGVSLMVTNPQLALDLKIVDRIESVPDLQDTGFYYSDTYTPTIIPATGYPVSTGTTANVFNDTFKNNRTRLINSYPGITDQPCITYVRGAKWNNDDSLTYGAPDRVFHGYEIKPNGLSVGDEWYFSTYSASASYGGFDNDIKFYLATPLANVKAGTPITAFANQYRQGLNLVNNPYKDYVTSIAIKPGDVLDGKQVGGKIWVNFTDYINLENEYITVDAIHPDFINLAYAQGTITLEQKNTYLSSPSIQTSPVGELTANTANKGAFWQSNGEFVLTQGNVLENRDGRSDFSGELLRKGTTRKTSAAGLTSASNTSFGGQFFTFTYARQFDQLGFENLSMNTRAFRWISDRAASVGQTQAHTAKIANATMVEPVVVPGKEITVNAQPMLSNATKVPAVGFAGADRVVITLPLEATARITEPSKVVIAAPMTSSVLFSPDYSINTTATDQVVVYVLHEDPILYLREDIIK